jgi:hypothetical protein
MAFQLAQINIARPRFPLDHPGIADFMAGLTEINALADAAPGFVWRLVDDSGNDATSLRPYGQDVMVNMSVWVSLEALRDYLYRTAHLDYLRRRREWFTHDDVGEYLALWWVPAGHLPTVDEARERLDHLAAHGPGRYAFTLRQPFPAPELDLNLG